MAPGRPRFSPSMLAAASIAVILLLIIALLARGHPAAAQAPPTLSVEKARVYWQAGGAEAKEEIGKGQSKEIAPGDTVVVDGLGRAALAAGTGMLATLYPNSQVLIQSLDEQMPALALAKGALYLDSPPTGIPLTVAAGDATVRADGRVFIYYDARNKSAWVVVKQGTADVTSGGSSVALSDRQQTWTTEGGAPVQAQPANRKVTGARFYLIDDITNRTLRESDLLAPAFPWWSIALVAVAAVVTGGALVVRRRKHAARMQTGRRGAGVEPQPVQAKGVADQATARLAELTIGRAHDNRLVLDDALASGHHARIRLSDGNYLIEDLDSTNGTFVNGARVKLGALRDGNRVRIGTSHFVFRAADMALVPAGSGAVGGSPRLESSSAWIEILTPDGGVHRSPVTGERFVIGRQPDNDLVLQDAAVSRHHAAVSYDAGKWTIEDVRSTGGVWVDGSRVRKASLRNGAQIQLGRTSLIFHFEPETEEEAPK